MMILSHSNDEACCMSCFALQMKGAATVSFNVYILCMTSLQIKHIYDLSLAEQASNAPKCGLLCRKVY